MSNKIRVKVYADGDFAGTKEFDQDVIKIGTLKSSNLHLDGDGVARMHAVIERSGDVYRIIDLGSLKGCVLDGIPVDKNATLPKTGTLKIGSFKVEYECDAAPQNLPPREAKVSESVSFSGSPNDADYPNTHHNALYDSLLEELQKISPGEAQAAAKYRKGNQLWDVLSAERRRGLLRTMVSTIRQGRQETTRFARQRVASMINLGAEGLEAVYELSHEDALDKAHETLLAIQQAKDSLALLEKMNLAKTVTEGAAAAAVSKEDAEKTAAQFKKGHGDLEERLQITVAGGLTLLVAYISRAGGEELTDEDRRKWREQFAQIEEAAKEMAKKDQRGQLTVIS